MKKFLVWEPAVYSAREAEEIEADTHGQAAFLCASKRGIGHREATFFAYDGTEARTVKVEPRTWYAVVGVSEPLQTVRAENDSPPSTDAS